MGFIFEALFEFILTLIFEGGVEVGTNKKRSKWIRYPLLLLVGAIYVGFFALLIFLGFRDLEDELWRAILTWVFALALFILTIWGIHGEYEEYKRREKWRQKRSGGKKRK